MTEPYQYCFKIDKIRSLALYREWAELEWQQTLLACGDAAATPSYAAGFQDGFVDYVYAGGTGEPPPVPPREFWNVALRSLDGKAMVNEWFEGYRHGAQVAMEGGYRTLATIHTSFTLPPGSNSSDTKPPAGTNPPPQQPDVETLPAPPVPVPPPAEAGETVIPIAAPVTSPDSPPGKTEGVSSNGMLDRSIDERVKASVPAQPSDVSGDTGAAALEPNGLPIDGPAAESKSMTQPIDAPANTTAPSSESQPAAEPKPDTSSQLPLGTELNRRGLAASGDATSSAKLKLNYPLDGDALATNVGFPSATGLIHPPASSKSASVIFGAESPPSSSAARDALPISPASTTAHRDSAKKDETAADRSEAVRRRATTGESSIVVVSGNISHTETADKFDDRTAREKYRATFFAK